VYLSPATLVIVPSALIPHWKQQIWQHIGLAGSRLRVCVVGDRGDRVHSTHERVSGPAAPARACCWGPDAGTLGPCQQDAMLGPWGLDGRIARPWGLSAGSFTPGPWGLSAGSFTPTLGRSIMWQAQLINSLPPLFTQLPPVNELAWHYDIVISTFNRLSSEWSLKTADKLPPLLKVCGI